MRSSVILFSIVAIISIVFGFASGQSPEGEREPSPATTAPKKIHDDPAGLEDAMVDASRAVLRDNVVDLQQALDRVASRSRRMFETDPDSYSSRLTHMDRGFHLTLDAAREFANASNLVRAVEQYRWVFKGCRECHVIAREDGLLPNRPLGQ